MLEQHLSNQQLDRYRSFALLPDEMANVYAHLDSCDACRARLEQISPANVKTGPIVADLLVGKWNEPWHIDNEQASGYVDGVLDSVERELVISHLEICTSCVQKIRDLRAFRTLLSTYPQQSVQPLPPQTLRSWLLALWRLPAGRFTIQTLAPTVAAALVVFLLMPRAPKHSLNEQNHDVEKIAGLEQQVKEADGRADAANNEKAHLTQELRAQHKQYDALRTTNKRLEQQLDKAAGITVLAGNLLKDRHGDLALRVPVRTEDRGLVTQALRDGKVNIPPLTSLVSHTVASLGPGQKHTIELIQPKRSFILSDQPTFQWGKVPGAMRYRLTLSVGQEAFLEVDIESNAGAWTAMLYDTTKYPRRKGITIVTNSETEWTPPKGTLKPNLTYQWSVDAYSSSFDDDKKIAETRAAAKFQILSAKQRSKVELARTQYANSHLLLGIFYAHQGLLDDAEREYRAYLQIAPADTQAKKLLADLKANRKEQ